MKIRRYLLAGSVFVILASQALFVSGCASRRAASGPDISPVSPNAFATPPPASEFTHSCDGQVHGTIQNGYTQPSMVGGLPCPTGSRTCINGEWVGAQLYPTCQKIPHP